MALTPKPHGWKSGVPKISGMRNIRKVQLWLTAWYCNQQGGKGDRNWDGDSTALFLAGNCVYSFQNILLKADPNTLRFDTIKLHKLYRLLINSPPHLDCRPLRFIWGV